MTDGKAIAGEIADYFEGDSMPAVFHESLLSKDISRPHGRGINPSCWRVKSTCIPVCAAFPKDSD